jgi:hypothetical protein
MGERSSFAGVIKVLYECRERVEFGGCSVPTLVRLWFNVCLREIPSNEDFFGVLS